MSQTSNVSSLKALLQEKTRQDQQENRALILSEQEKLLNDLQGTYRSALDTTLTDIRDSLKSRLGDMAMLTAQEAQTVEKMVEDYQQKLNKTMLDQYAKTSKSIRSQLEPTENSLDELIAKLNQAQTGLEQITQTTNQSAKAVKRQWIIGATAALSLLIFISLGSWGLIQYLSSQVQQNLALIEQQKQTIQSLNNQTLGVQIIQASNGTFLILPPNAQDGYTLGGRPAIKLQTN